MMHFPDLADEASRIKNDLQPFLDDDLAGIDKDTSFRKRTSHTVAALQNGKGARRHQS